MTFNIICDIFVDIMYIDDYSTVINGKKYKRALLRESYREGEKVNKRTIASLAHASDSQIDAIKLALKNSDDIVALKNARAGTFTSSGKSVGAVGMLYQVAQILGITKALGKSREAILFLWLVFARLIDQGSRLSATRLARQHVVCEIMGVEGFDENDLYQAMDWGCANQAKIESKLFQFLMHKKRSSDSDSDSEFEAENIFLYDVTSTYLEGNQNELAEYGYNRDKKQGKRQIIYGLLTDKEGIPLAVEAFKGNTKDNKTLLSQIAKIKERFGVKYVTLVGDKGMIKSIEIEAIDEDEKFNYITSITKPQIEKLLKREVISLGLFDEKLAEVFDQEDGKRYILRRNPHRVEEMKLTRGSKLSKVRNKISSANTYLSEHPRGKVKTQANDLRKYLEKLKLNDYVEVVEQPLGGGVGGGKSQTRRVGVGIEIDQDKLDELSKLDGCYVLKTNLEKSKNLSKEIIHERYKALSEVEWAFRTQKTGYLEVRPVFVRKETRTRAHLLITMLSYRLEHFLRKRWKDIDLTVEEGIKKLSRLSSVIINVRSEKLHRVPKPDKLSELLLNAVQVKLPGILPLIEDGVDTKTKLQKGRK